MRPISLSVFLCLLGAALVWPQQQLTLDQAVSLAVQRNRRLQVLHLELRNSQEALSVSRTYRLPQFRFNLFEGELVTRPSSTFPAGVFGLFPLIGPVPPAETSVTTARKPFTLVFGQVNQPLSQLFRIGLGIDAQQLSVQLAQEKINQEEAAVAGDVKKAYYNLWQAQSALRATEDTVKLFQELKRVASEGLAQQVVLKSDVLDTEAGLAKVQLQQVSLRNTASTLKDQMNSLLGRDLNTEFEVAPLPEANVWELDLAATRARALEQRPELREARLKVRQAEIDRRAKKAEYLPDVSLSFNYISPFNIQVVPKNVAAIGVFVNWDVFDWGRKKHELAAKANTVEEAKTALEEASAQIQVEVGLDFRKLQEARQQLQVADLELQADQEKVRVAVNRYDQKSVLLKDVLQFRTSLAEKTYKYQEDLSAFWTARADLEKAVGQR